MMKDARLLKGHPKLIVQIVRQIPIGAANQLQSRAIQGAIRLYRQAVFAEFATANLLQLKVFRAINIAIDLQVDTVLGKMLELLKSCKKFSSRPSWYSRERLATRSITRCH